MQVSLSIVNWNELSKFSDIGAFAEWRGNRWWDPGWIKSGTKIGWDNDSASAYFDIADALENIGPTLHQEQAQAVGDSLAMVLCGDEGKTRQDFSAKPDSGYFLSLSPITVSGISTSLKLVDIEQAVQALTAELAKDDPEMDIPELNEEIRDYIAQTINIVETAAKKKWGVIGHVG